MEGRCRARGNLWVLVRGHLSVCLLDALPLPAMPKVCNLDSALLQSVPSSSIHSVTSMRWASSWESLLGTNRALFQDGHIRCRQYLTYYALPVLLALGVVSNMTGRWDGTYCWAGA